jgi:serine/threonine-protein kinase RsbW
MEDVLLEYPEVIEMQIPSNTEYLMFARRTVEGIAKRLNFNEIEIEDIKVAFGEACTNAIVHGNKAENVNIRWHIFREELCIEIENSTKCFAIPDNSNIPETNKNGGFGVFIMRTLMDEVHMRHFDNIATVRMIKKLPGKDRTFN